jgi:hypothetical protein
LSITFEDVAKLEKRFVREGRDLEARVQDSQIQLVREWVGELEAQVDADSLALLSRYVRGEHSGRVVHLALGALSYVHREVREHPERVPFALRFALQRLRALAGEAPLWCGVELSAETALDVEALFAAARGDRSFTDDQLVLSAWEFAEKHECSGHLFGKLSSGLRLLVGVLLNKEAERSCPVSVDKKRA